MDWIKNFLWITTMFQRNNRTLVFIFLYSNSCEVPDVEQQILKFELQCLTVIFENNAETKKEFKDETIENIV